MCDGGVISATRPECLLGDLLAAPDTGCPVPNEVFPERCVASILSMYLGIHQYSRCGGGWHALPNTSPTRVAPGNSATVGNVYRRGGAPFFQDTLVHGTGARRWTFSSAGAQSSRASAHISTGGTARAKQWWGRRCREGQRSSRCVVIFHGPRHLMPHVSSPALHVFTSIRCLIPHRPFNLCHDTISECWKAPGIEMPSLPVAIQPIAIRPWNG